MMFQQSCSQFHLRAECDVIPYAFAGVCAINISNVELLYMNVVQFWKQLRLQLQGRQAMKRRNHIDVRWRLRAWRGSAHQPIYQSLQQPPLVVFVLWQQFVVHNVLLYVRGVISAPSVLYPLPPWCLSQDSTSIIFHFTCIMTPGALRFDCWCSRPASQSAWMTTDAAAAVAVAAAAGVLGA